MPATTPSSRRAVFGCEGSPKRSAFLEAMGRAATPPCARPAMGRAPSQTRGKTAPVRLERGVDHDAGRDRLAEAERRQRILSEVSRVLLDYAGPDEVEPLRRVVGKVAAALEND